MIIGDLHFDILVHHGMLNIHLVQTIHLLQDEGDIPGPSHQERKGIGTDHTPGHLIDREVVVEAGVTAGA